MNEFSTSLDPKILASLVRSADNPQALNLGVEREFNLITRLERSLQGEQEQRLALISGDQILTARQLQERLNQAGNFLRAHQVGIERRLAILVKEAADFIPLFLGAIKIGVIPVPLPPNLRSHEWRYLLDESRPALAVVDPQYYLEINQLCRELPWKTEVIPTSPLPQAADTSFQEELVESSSDLAPANTITDDIAFWVYTQGTSGFPKATLHLQRAPLYSCASFADQILQLTAQDVLFSTSPLHSSQGIMEKIFFPLYSSTPIIASDEEVEPAQLLELINRHQPSVFFSTPPVYHGLLQALEQEHEPAVFANLRACVSTNQALPLATQLNWQKYFQLEIINALTSTEALYAYITNRPGETKIGSLGKVAPGYVVRLEDKYGLPVAPGQIGNLLVLGGSTTIGYWAKPKRNAKLLFGPWLDTGDKCIVDEEGYYFFSGKREDMILIDERWISPRDVEANLLSLPEVAQAAVVNAIDQNDKTCLRAYIVLKPNLEPSAEMAATLKVKANADQPAHLHIRWLDFVPDLPRSSNGKLQRYKLR